MSYQDEYYEDQNGALHFLSAEDQANAAAQGLALPDPSWVIATQTRVDAITNQTTADIKTAAQAAIDQAAGAASARYITIGEGQEGRYLLKAKQADEYKAAAYPTDTSAYPMIQAEANATNATPKAAADNIIATRDQWMSVAAQIEQARITGKAAIATLSSTATANKINSVRDTYIAQLEAV